MKSFIKKLSGKNIQYNILSLINVVIAFFFVLLLGRHFGIGSTTDTYFFATVIITYLGFFVQAAWEAMRPYYVKLKITDEKSSHVLYSVLLNVTVLLSFIIIAMYFLISKNISIFTADKKEFLDIFIFYILFQNILLLNKMVLNLEELYAAFYLVDIFVYSVNVITVIVFLKTDILLIAYSTLIATFIANIWQFHLIFKRLTLKYYFKFYYKGVGEIYKNSTKIKLGAFLYGAKEPLLATAFLSLGDGLYSLYSYANKFSSALFQITNGPVMNVYITRLNQLVAKNNYFEISGLIKKVHIETLSLYLISIISFYFFMPIFLKTFFGDGLSQEELEVIKSIYIYISIFYMVIVIEAPFARTMGAFKLFNYSLFANTVFSVYLAFLYIYFITVNSNYIIYLTVIITAQATNLILYFLKNKQYLKAKYEIHYNNANV